MTADWEDRPDWLAVSRETFARLLAFQALVLKWTPTVNLISRASVSQIWERHMLDSAQLAFLVETPVAHWADLGSGGGFPAIVVAVIAQERLPQARFTLVESDARKAAFLAQCLRQLDLPGRVLTERIESLQPLGADVISARALAPLDVLLDYCHRHLAPGGAALLPKGAANGEEIEKARKRWHFAVTANISRTDSNAAILKVSGIAPV